MNKLVEEAPYHPGYEDAPPQVDNPNTIMAELNEYRRMNALYSKFSNTIIDHIKNQKYR